MRESRRIESGSLAACDRLSCVPHTENDTRCVWLRRPGSREHAILAGYQPLMPVVFPITGRPAKLVGRTPRSAAGHLASLPVADETDPLDEERVPTGTRADGVVRPTSFAEFSELEKRVALMATSLPHLPSADCATFQTSG